MSRRDVIGWKYPPQHWYPELPGKDDAKRLAGARTCPDCNKTTLDFRQRFCGACAHRRRLKTIRESKRRSRTLTVKPILRREKKSGLIDTPDPSLNC